MSNPLKKLASQTAVYGLSSILGRLLNYLLTPLYTYAFSPSEYGVVVELYTYVSFLVVILTYGMETAFFRFDQQLEKDKRVYSTSFTSLLISTIAFILICSIFNQNIVQFLDYHEHPEYIQWFVYIVAIDAITAIPFALLRSQNKAKRFAFVRLINIGINIFLNLFFILICPRLFGNQTNMIYNPSIGVGYIFISNLIASAATIVLLIPELKQASLKIDKEIWRKMMLYAMPLLIAGLAGMVNETMDRVLLKYLLPQDGTVMSKIGIYGACYKISIILTIFVQTFRYAAEPFFFSQQKNKDSKELYAKVLYYFVIICSFIFIGTMSYIDIVQHFIGEAFREGLFIVPILLLANLCLGIFVNLSIWYKLSGQTKYGAYLTIIGASITLIANVILIPIMGYPGAAWATLICYATIMIVSYVIGQKNFKVPYNLSGMAMYLGVAILMYFIQHLFLQEMSQNARLGINSLMMVCYLAMIFLKEKSGLKSFTAESN